MQQPLEIVFEDLEPSDAIREKVGEEMHKLEQLNSRMTSARVVIAKPHHHQQRGSSYQVRIHITGPGMKDVVVTHEPGDNKAHDDAYITIRDAFQAARRQLRDAKRD